MSFSVGDGYAYEWQMRDDHGSLNIVLRDPIRCFVSFEARYVLRTRKYAAGLGVFYNHDEVIDTMELPSEVLRFNLFMEPMEQKSFERWAARTLAQLGLPYAARQKLYDDIVHSALLMKNDPINRGRKDVYLIVDITVCTLHQEGESIEETRSRAILADTFLRGLGQKDLPELHEEYDFGKLEKFRGRCDTDECLRVCSICLEKPCIGEEICILPCTHSYHFPCISRWLQKRDFCPYCRSCVPN